MLCILCVCCLWLTHLIPGAGLVGFLFSFCAGLPGGCAHRFLGVDIPIPKWTFCACFRQNRGPGRGNCDHPGGKQHFGCPFLRSSGPVSRSPLVWWKTFCTVSFCICLLFVSSLRRKISVLCNHSRKSQIMEAAHSLSVLCVDQTEVSLECIVSQSLTALKFLHFPTVLKNGMSVAYCSGLSPPAAKVPGYRPTGLHSPS